MSNSIIDEEQPELQRQIEKLGLEFAFENLDELKEQLKEYHELCKFKARIERLVKEFKV